MPYRTAPVKHDHKITLTIEEVIEAVNLLRAKRNLPQAHADASVRTTQPCHLTHRARDSAPKSLEIIEMAWQVIE